MYVPFQWVVHACVPHRLWESRALQRGFLIPRLTLECWCMQNEILVLSQFVEIWPLQQVVRHGARFASCMHISVHVEFYWSTWQREIMYLCVETEFNWCRSLVGHAQERQDTGFVNPTLHKTFSWTVYLPYMTLNFTHVSFAFFDLLTMVHFCAWILLEKYLNWRMQLNSSKLMS